MVVNARERPIYIYLFSLCTFSVTETCKMAGHMFNNTAFIEKAVCYMCTICRVFGKNYTQSRVSLLTWLFFGLTSENVRNVNFLQLFCGTLALTNGV